MIRSLLVLGVAPRSPRHILSVAHNHGEALRAIAWGRMLPFGVGPGNSVQLLRRRKFATKCIWDSGHQSIPNIPDGRLAEPEEVAALVIYPCSKEAAFLTGGNIAINGGQHLQ